VNAQDAIERLAQVGAEFRRYTLAEQAATLARSLEETEVTYEQQQSIATTGRGISFEEARARVQARKGTAQQPGDLAAQLATDDQPVQQLGGVHVVSRVPTAIAGVTNRK